MATESVNAYLIEADDLEQIRWMLLDAIKAQSELEQLKTNIRLAAAEGMSAKSLESVMPRPVDLDMYQVAEAVQVLAVLPHGQRLNTDPQEATDAGEFVDVPVIGVAK